MYFVCIVNVLYYCVFCIFWTLYVRQCHIFENVLLYVVTDGPFGLVFINKLETIYGHGGHLGHVTSIMSSDFHFLVPESFQKIFVSDRQSGF